MIKQCTCGRYPKFRESGIGWQAVCPDCYKFVAGWMTRELAIAAWNNMKRGAKLYTKEEVVIALNRAVEHAISHL